MIFRAIYFATVLTSPIAINWALKPAAIFAAAHTRIRKLPLQPNKERGQGRFGRIPLTSQEARRKIKEQYQRGKARLLPFLSDCGSKSGQIFQRLSRNRPM